MKIFATCESIERATGGPPLSIGQLGRGLRLGGHDYTVVHPAPAAGADVVKYEENHYLTLPKQSSYDQKSLVKWAFQKIQESQVDIVFLNGIWNAQNSAFIRAANHAGALVVSSPRGTLDPFSFRQKWWKKIIAWNLFLKWLYRFVHGFHATSQLECSSIRKFGFRQDVGIVGNIIEIPICGPKCFRSSGRRKIGFIGRIHRQKAIESLIHAGSRLKDLKVEFSIAGNASEDYLKELKRLVSDLKLSDRFEFPGPLKGEAKTEWYESLDLFVLPSPSENFGLVIAEALAFNVPVIATKGTPWETLERHECGWWVEPTVDGIINALNDGLRRSADQLSLMGRRGREYVENEFCAETVARKMANYFVWLGSKESLAKPEFVNSMKK
jgi:glycosyltransferase involved in cell wall biosynthesis